MPTLTYTLADVTLKSTWNCYQNSSGSYGSTTPSTKTTTRTVTVSGIPSGATINSAVLSYDVPGNPLNGAEISTLNGVTIGWRKGSHTANLGITGNGDFQLLFAFKDYGAQHSHVQSHSSSWSLTNLVVTIVYTDPYYPSEWSVGAASVDAGNPIPVTISPKGSGYSHKIKAVFGSYSTEVNFATGVNVGSIPTAMSWLHAIPSATAGTANLTLTTYYNGNQIGTSTKSVTITAPASVVPALEATVDRVLTIGGTSYPDVTGGYVQQKSAVLVRITSASGVYGSTITEYSINIGGRSEAAYNSSSTSLTSPALPMSGTVAITFRVTDSRGRTAQVIKTISVEPYSEPKANNLTVMRVDDSGNEDANGTKGWYSFTRIFASLGGKNTCTATITAAGASVENVGDSGWIVPGAVKTLDVLSSYRVEIKLTDAYGSTTTVAIIPSINFALHFSADGTSLWVGEACQKNHAFGVAPNRDVYFYGKELRTMIPVHNLLDNSNFEIAQAGYPGQHGSTWFVADRWEAEQRPNTAMYDNHFAFNAHDGGQLVVVQKTTTKVATKLIGKTITLAACTDAGEILCASDTVVYDQPIAQIVYGEDWSLQLQFFQSSGSYQLARFIVNAGKTANINWVALYEGEYTAETLPPYVPKGYAAEMAECLRYFERKHYHLYGNGTSSMFYSLQYSCKRIYPTITTIVTETKSDNVTVANEVWNANPTSSGGLLCTVSNDGHTAYWYGYFDISADL